jgi:DNA-binding transcriptional MerR regulator
MMDFETLFNRDWIGHGEAAAMLEVHPNTLRSWVDAMEELRVHCLQRNLNNERIYRVNDLRIYNFIKEERAKHGSRRVTSKELGVMIQEQFECNTNFAEILGEDEKIPLKEDPEETMVISPEEMISAMMAMREAASGIQQVATSIQGITMTVENTNQKVELLEKRLKELEDKPVPALPAPKDDRYEKLQNQIENMSFGQRIKFLFKGKLS